MPKTKTNRRFHTDWLSEPWAKGWLQEKKSGKTSQAYCMYCHSDLRIHFTDLKKHATTKQHITNAKTKIISKKETVNHYFKPTLLTREQKKQDLILTMFILNHAAIKAVDHISELLSKISNDTTFTNLRLHRTKCSCLIKSVISPSLLNNIVEAVGDQRYSIIIDESTDVTVNKYLAVLIRYFNGNAIVNDFLGLIEVERATAVDLHTSLNKFFKKINLPIKNMLAVGTDGGSNLCGRNNSVYTLLKENIPDLILLKCVCHSIHLSVSKASEELPSSLDFLAHEIYNWFSNSPLRKTQYEQIFNLINIGEGKTFKKFIQLSRTRWLCRYNVTKRILEHWLELQTFFVMTGKEEKCHKARILGEMLHDDKLLLYMKFILPVLQDMNNLNLLFQSDYCDIGSTYLQYFLTIESLGRRLIKPIFLNNKPSAMDNKTSDTLLLKNISRCVDNPLSYLPVEMADLGYDFSTELENNKTINPQEKLEIRQRCFRFFTKLLGQLIERLPSNLDSYKTMRLLSPVNCLNENSTHAYADLPIQQYILPSEDKHLIENQWRKLPMVKWKDEFQGQDIPDSLLKFWPTVYKFKDGAGHQVFKELSTVVLRMLSLPTSNAAVERAFSIMNNVKTKARNRMKLELLEAIMRIKIFYFARGQCCLNFVPTDLMLTTFNSNMYNNSSEENENDLDAALELME